MPMLYKCMIVGKYLQIAQQKKAMQIKVNYRYWQRVKIFLIYIQKTQKRLFLLVVQDYILTHY